jgi:4-nitrophenyl phosphatase
MTFELRQIRNLILDMDGVLWHGDIPMPGLAEFFDTLRALDIGFVLATNNATKVAAQYTKKLEQFGLHVSTDLILTSAEATAGFLRQQYPDGATVYTVGEAGLCEALRNHGFTVLPQVGFVEPGTSADVVVVGLDRFACWERLASAAYLVQRGARFVGTNPDATFPNELGAVAGAGAFLAFVATASGVAPEIVGKPERAVFAEALRRLQAHPASTAMVGDRLETDILGGQEAGLHTILLLSGVTSREKLTGHPVQPGRVFDDISALGAALLAAQREEIHGRAR